MSTTPWHVERPLLAAYARGDVDDADAFSVEAHIVGCAHCQAQVRRVVAPDRLDATWLEIVDTLDAPRAGLRGARADAARRRRRTSPGCSPPRRRSRCPGSAAVAVALAVAVAGAHQGERGLTLFLCVAALAPVAGRRGELHARAGPDARAGRSPRRCRASGCCSCAPWRCSARRSR